MTNSPACLQVARNFVIEHLDAHPGKTVPADLDPAEVGIVGDPKHRGGYHCGRDRVDSDDYSVRESPRDKSGLTLDACALDVGWFEVRSKGAVHNLRTFSLWVVAQCKANAADTRDIREVIYSPDGRRVLRWDRLGKRSTGDSSHLFHTHFSFFRDAVKAGRDQTALFRRYLTEIGLLEDEMAELTAAQAGSLDVCYEFARSLIDYSVEWGDTKRPGGKIHNGFMEHFKALVDDVAAIKATPPGSVTISDEQLERVLRKVVGSVDGASPAS